MFVTGPPNGSVLFCSMASVGVCRLSFVVVCDTAGGRTCGPPLGAREVGRPTLHGRPVVLRPVRATPC